MTEIRDALGLDSLRAIALAALDNIERRIEEERRVLREAAGIPPEQQALGDKSFDDIEAAAPGLFDRDSYVNSVSVPQPASISQFAKRFNDSTSAIVNLISTVAGADQILRQAAITARTALVDLSEEMDLSMQSFDIILDLANAGYLRPPQPADVDAIATQAENAAAQADEDATELERAVLRREAARRNQEEEQPAPLEGTRVAGRDYVPVEGTDDVITATDATAEVQATRVGRTSQGLSEQFAELKDSLLQEITFLAVCSALKNLQEVKGRLVRVERTLERVKNAVDSVLNFAKDDFVDNVKGAIQEATVLTLRAISLDVVGVAEKVREYLTIANVIPPPVVETVRSTADDFPETNQAQHNLANLCDLRSSTFCAITDLIYLSNAAQNQVADQVKKPEFTGSIRFFLDDPEESDVPQPLPAPDPEVDLILVEPEPAGSTQITVKQRTSLRPTIVIPGATTANQYEQGGVLSGGPGRIVLGGESEDRETIDYDSSSFDQFSLEYVINLSNPTANPHGPVLLSTPDGRRTSVLFSDPDPTIPAKRIKIEAGSLDTIEAQNGDITFTSWGLSPGDKLILGQDPIPVEIQSIAAGSITLTEDYWDGPIESTVCLLLQPINPAGSSSVRTRIPPAALRDIDIGNGGTVILSSAQLLNKRRTDGTMDSTGTELTSNAPIFPSFLTEPGFLVRISDRGGFFTRKVDLVSSDGKTVTFATPVSGDDAFLDSVTISGGTNLNQTGIGDVLTPGASVQLDNGDVSAVAARVDKDNVTLSTAVTNGTFDAYRTALTGVTDTTDQVSFSAEGPLREEKAYTSITLVGDDIYDINLSTPTAIDHDRGVIAVEGTARTVPTSTEAYRTTPAESDLRLDPDQWPIGSTSLLMTIEDPAILTDPLLAPAVDALALPGRLKIISGSVEEELEHTGGVAVDVGVYRFGLSTPTTIAWRATTEVLVDTLGVIDHFADVLTEGWADPLDQWLADLRSDVDEAIDLVCRILAGREQDMVPIVTRMRTSTVNAILTVEGVLRLVDLALLGAPPPTGEVTVALSVLDDSGADVAAEKVRTGQIESLLCLDVFDASSRGEAVRALSDYTSKGIDFENIRQVADVQSQIHGEDVGNRLASEVREGFEAGAERDADAELRTIKNQKQKLDRIT